MDIVDHILTKELDWETDDIVQRRVFSAQEIQLYANDRTLRFLTGRYAVKEAVLKCLGVGMQDGIALTSIEITRETNGKPLLHLSGEVKLLSDEKKIEHWHVSITHTESVSVGFVVAEGR